MGHSDMDQVPHPPACLAAPGLGRTCLHTLARGRGALCRAVCGLGFGRDRARHGTVGGWATSRGGGFTDMHWVRGREKARERGRKGEGEGERVREREVLWNHWHAIYLPILSLCATLI